MSATHTSQLLTLQSFGDISRFLREGVADEDSRQLRDSLGAPSAGDAATSENLWGNDASGSEAPAGAASEADGAAAPADPASAASAEESSAAPTPGGYGSDDPLKSLQESIKK